MPPMKKGLCVSLLTVAIFGGAAARIFAAPPPAPAPLAPVSDASVQEPFTISWSSVSDPSGIVAYNWQVSSSSSFTPVILQNSTNNGQTTAATVSGLANGNPAGNYFARVLAVNANGVFSAPSNVISFSVFFNNPVPPALSPLSPPNGATLTLPITITWTDSPNPQPSGYDLQIARDSNFQSIEDLHSQLNDPTRTVLSLTPGQKFWRVHSVQGSASPTTAAVTPWSATRTFTVSSAPPTPVSVSSTTDPLTSGDTTWLQL